MTSALLNRTLALLAERPKTVFLKDIAEGSGLGLRWLEALVAGRIADPGVIKIERLYNYLAQGRLDV